MKVSRKEAKVIRSAIREWQQSGLVDESLASRLDQNVEVMLFDWKKLAKYSFWIAVLCFLGSFFGLFAIAGFMSLVEAFMEWPYWLKFLFFLSASTVIFRIGYLLQKQSPEKLYRNEAVMLIGAISTLGVVYQLGQLLNQNTGHFSVLILLACLSYGVLGFVLRSPLIWLFSLISFGSWMGAETGYLSGWGAYYLGMNYPLRFAFLGVVMVLGTLSLEKVEPFKMFFKTTLVMGLLDLFLSLWIMSIFGNYGDINQWKVSGPMELLQWSVLFGVAALGAIFHGLKFDNGAMRGFGITFLFINLYTRYFEYFWDSSNKTIFFGILGLSFWVVGSKAEKIWNLGKGSHLFK